MARSLQLFPRTMLGIALVLVIVFAVAMVLAIITILTS